MSKHLLLLSYTWFHEENIGWSCQSMTKKGGIGLCHSLPNHSWRTTEEHSWTVKSTAVLTCNFWAAYDQYQPIWARSAWFWSRRSHHSVWQTKDQLSARVWRGDSRRIWPWYWGWDWAGVSAGCRVWPETGRDGWEGGSERCWLDPESSVTGAGT